MESRQPPWAFTRVGRGAVRVPRAEEGGKGERTGRGKLPADRGVDAAPRAWHCQEALW